MFEALLSVITSNWISLLPLLVSIVAIIIAYKSKKVAEKANDIARLGSLLSLREEYQNELEEKRASAMRVKGTEEMYERLKDADAITEKIVSLDKTIASLQDAVIY